MTKYISMVLAGAVSYGILSSFVKLAYGQGYNPAEIAFAQAFIGALLLWTLTGFAKKQQTDYRLTRKTGLLLLGTGAAIGLSTFLYYLSVRYIPASLAIVLLMQFTWIGLLFEWTLFKRKPSGRALLITLFILAGTVLAGKLSASDGLHLSWQGVVSVLLASVLYAGYIVANSRVGGQVLSLTKSAVIVTGAALAIFLVNAPSLVLAHHWGGGLLRWGVFLALFGTVIPPVLFARGIPQVGAELSGILMTAELPVAVLTAHFILNESLDGSQLLGIMIMLGSIAAMNVYKGRRK